MHVPHRCWLLLGFLPPSLQSRTPLVEISTFASGRRSRLATGTGAWSRTAVRGGSEAVPATGTTTVHSVIAVFHLSDDNNRPTKDSPLSWLVGEDVTPCSAVLLGEVGTEEKKKKKKSPIYRIPRLPHDPYMMSSLGILSDAIVVVLPSDTSQALKLLDQEFSERLVEIANSTAMKCLPRKKSLVIVSESANESWWVEEVVQTHLRSIEPSVWDTFDILTPENFQALWQQQTSGNLLLGGNVISSFADSVADSVVGTLISDGDNAEVYARLLQQVYRHLSSKDGSKLVEVGNSFVADPGFFALEAVPNTSNVILPTTSSIRKSTTIEGSTLTTMKSRHLLEEDPQDRIQKILQDAQAKVANLESKMQEIQLESHSRANNRALPLLDFGVEVNAILDRVYRELEQFPVNVRVGFMNRLVLEVHHLYREHLQSLRDYYGRRYELSLDREEEEAVWAAEAEHMTEGFQTAARHAVPSLCQGDGPLAKIVNFESVNVLQGLLQDMMEATQLRKDEQSLAFDEEETEGLSSNQRRRVPPWVKKIASRLIALGVNYLQGWLAWQGIKRAALERDREMPKFPLF